MDVKALAGREHALGAVAAAIWHPIARAADFRMARHVRYADHGWRYDLIAVPPGRLPQHVRNA
ncbi:hypothetical protein [Hyphomonas sp.]|uniref:hypothetical protein n=1 Tax=Hyphomonas sp. TaxID=87 RepID=UPI003D27E64A